MSGKAEQKRTASKQEAVEIRFLEGVLARDSADYRVLQALGDLYTKVGRFNDGLAVDQQLVRLCPDDALVHYNLACSYALTQAPDRAFQALEKAIRLGYDEADWIQQDEDLATLREDPRFKSVLDKLQKLS